MKTSTQLSRCCWVRKTNLRAKINFTWGGGIHHSSVSQSQSIHKVLRLKCYKNRRAQQLTEAHSTHALFSVCSLRDDNVITSKPTWKLKHANSILEPSEYFCQISSKSIHTISSYTVAKLSRFFETQCIYMLSPVRLSVRRSHGCIIEKRVKIGLLNFHHTVAPAL